MDRSEFGFATNEDINGQHHQTRLNPNEYDDNVVHGDCACSGCGARISDRYYLSAVGRRWHVTCLRCCACHKQLDPAVTCYMNSGNVYCEFDFRRLFMSRDCVGCCEPILPQDMVMWIRNANGVGDKPGSHVIYHARCFACVRCDSGRALSAGEHYGMQDGRVYCRAHYCELQLELRSQTAAVSTRGSVAAGTAPTTRRTGMRGRPRKLRPTVTVRPPTADNHSPRLCTDTPAVNNAEPTDPTDHCSERMSSDVSDDAIHDDANSSNGGGGGSSNGAWDDSGTGNGVTRRKRMRSSFKHHQLKIMKSYFQSNHNPDAKELREIALKTGLMTRVIQVWFQNARAKFRRNLSKQQLQQQQILGYVGDHHPMTSSSGQAWNAQHHLAAEPDDDDDRHHVTDRDFRYCRRYAGDVIGAFDRAVTQCRDCCSVDITSYSGDGPSQLSHYQQLYQ